MEDLVGDNEPLVRYQLAFSLGSMQGTKPARSLAELAFRDAGNDDRFYDIDFRAMQREPIEVVRGLYEWLGEPVSDEFESGMRRWWKENAEDREQNVKPDPALYGLDLDDVREQFADYRARILGE